jgi:hypothetical protein
MVAPFFRLLRRVGLSAPCHFYALDAAAGAYYSLIVARRIGASFDLLARALR